MGQCLYRGSLGTVLDLLIWGRGLPVEEVGTVTSRLRSVAVCCSVLQYVAVCCSVLR